MALTFPLTARVQWLLRAAPWAFYAGELLFDAIVDDAPLDLEWRKVQLVFTRATPTGTTEDVAVCSLNLLNFTDAAIDSSWTTADYVAAEARLNTFWTSVKTEFPDELVLSQYRWYRMRFADPMTDLKRFADSGPAVRITTSGVAGTSTAESLPYQVAVSVTLKTADRKHWGRIYLPAPSRTAISGSAYGRLDSTRVGNIATPAGVLLNGLWDDQLPLIVPTTQVNKNLVQGWMAVGAIQVDDILDVIRRRRPRTPAIRTNVIVS